MDAKELVAQLLQFDPWTTNDGECDPNPSDSFEDGASAVKAEAKRLLESENDAS